MSSVGVDDALPPAASRPLAFGAHRLPRLHLHRVHVELCSKRVALTLLCLAQFMVVLDISIMNVALPSIRSHLHVSQANLQWVVNAYTLTSGGLLLLGGRAADLLGRRRVFLCGLAIFSTASALGGLARSLDVLVAARALQGLGSAIVAPCTLSILTTTFPEGPERNRALGVWGSVAAAGGAIGVLLGGLLTQLFGWPAVMFVNVPIGIVVIAVSARAIRAESGLPDRHFDAPGALAVTGGLVAIVFAVVRSSAWGFGSARTLGVLALGLALLGVFVAQEQRWSKHPLVPLRIFQVRSVSAANLVMALVGSAIFSTFFFVSIYLQQVRGYSPLHAGLAFVPTGLAIVLASNLAPRLLPRLGPRPLLVAGLTCAAAATAWFTAWTPHGDYLTTVFAPEILFGLGAGMSFVPVTVAATSGVPAQEAGLASGLINMSRSVGGAIGLAALATVASSHTQALIGHRMPTQALAASALTGGFTRSLAIGAALTLAAALVAAVALPGRPRPAQASE
ncbi:MAG TPA: MFS transporter [Solirubrobacteraceae bacterium]|nr:MFS transporter [Solirubrobacteraceae bacterium]